MSEQMIIQLELPEELATFELPKGVHDRLQELLDRQDRGEKLSAKERREAEGLVDLVELLSVLRSRAQQQLRQGPVAS
jgi:hypothetical protein